MEIYVGNSDKGLESFFKIYPNHISFIDARIVSNGIKDFSTSTFAYSLWVTVFMNLARGYVMEKVIDKETLEKGLPEGIPGFIRDIQHGLQQARPQMNIDFRLGISDPLDNVTYTGLDWHAYANWRPPAQKSKWEDEKVFFNAKVSKQSLYNNNI